MERLTVRANGAVFHVARTGAGPPLLLLHGWPEFWLTFEPLMLRLADRYTLLALDLRGFGDSDKPDGPFGPDRHAADMLALPDALEPARVGVVGHDVGGGFAHYRAAHAGRIRMLKGEALPQPPIDLPTCVRWAEHDPLFPFCWTDRLGETFSRLDLARLPDVGHFPHREDPDRAAAEIGGFFARLQPR
jgi:pimeloyl-ACP methyl ester carboxylesterase